MSRDLICALERPGRALAPSVGPGPSKSKLEGDEATLAVAGAVLAARCESPAVVACWERNEERDVISSLDSGEELEAALAVARTAEVPLLLRGSKACDKRTAREAS